MAKRKYLWAQIRGALGAGEVVTRSVSTNNGSEEIETEVSFYRKDLFEKRIARHSNPPNIPHKPSATPSYTLEIRLYDWNDPYSRDSGDRIILEKNFKYLEHLLQFLDTNGYLIIKELIIDPENIPVKNKTTNPSVNPSKKLTPLKKTASSKPNIQKPREVKS